jgi:hypothetical protein
MSLRNKVLKDVPYLELCPTALGYKPWREPARDGEIFSGYLATDPAYI